jgi:hypothetical protein
MFLTSDRFGRPHLPEALPILYTRALSGHSLKFAAENFHRTCPLIDDIEKSVPKRRIVLIQTAAPIRPDQLFRNLGREGGIAISFVNSILITAPLSIDFS